MRVRQTVEYARWVGGLRDGDARRRIDVRIRRLVLGLAGDAKALGGGLRELRIDHGPGYRVYYAMRGDEVVLLLCGGDKSGQSSDIERARRLLETFDG